MKCHSAEILIEGFTLLSVNDQMMCFCIREHQKCLYLVIRALLTPSTDTKRDKLKMKRWANRAHNCKTTKRVEWDSSITWRSTWFDWSSYLIWLNITEGESAFYRQIPEHHTAEFQLVGSPPHYGDHLPLVRWCHQPLIRWCHQPLIRWCHQPLIMGWSKPPLSNYLGEMC
jgi:hypothetical protein